MSGSPYDVVIVGAGAAGCAAAMSLAPGTRALLVDRAAPAAARCCGGLLAPDAQAAVGTLGLALPADVRVEPEPRLVRVHDLDSGRSQTYRRNYVNLDRARFDAWLLELAAARVAFRPRVRFVGIDGGAGAPELAVRLSHEGREETVRTRVLVGADGAGSAVRRAAFPGVAAPPTMLAIQVRLACENPPLAHEVLFAARLTDFYAWAIPKPGSVLVGCAFSETRGVRQKFDAVLAWYRESLGLGGEILERSARRLTRPRTKGELFAGSGGVMLAGEAAGLVSPSSGEGLSFAMTSGAAAGRACAAREPAAAYENAFHRSARHVALKLTKARVIFSPTLRRWALRLPWCP